MTTHSRLLLLTLASACLIPVTREQYITDAAFEICTAENSCGDIGDGEQYEDFSDCSGDVEDLYEAAWPADACDAETISGDAFDDCLADAKDAACDEGILDYIDAVEACRSGNVCSN